MRACCRVPQASLERRRGGRFADGDLRSACEHGRPAPLQPGDDRAIERAAMNQVNRVNRPRLANPIDAPDSLFQTPRRPRELHVDDESTARLQVQPFSGRIGRDERSNSSAIECVDDPLPLSGR